VAKAIYAGLLEYCCDLCDWNKGRLAKALDGFLQFVGLTPKLPAAKEGHSSTREGNIGPH
jgi:hypothetical protein